ncbi:2OG-Fe(II) oxygenase [Enhygromyxa salina]|uniref:Fe2OG dioxygenase domain-containing protein n=1 Tax=Enhygromyxa salina TaxID=215803 RepID=A0A2S9XQM6_9BACT|nr:2OG-Fe(II) oxygenase [Enhygromyxa salina]PRP95164.1 hypothetical protein ENSA7_74780 [Enhygromyxa salina]
MSAPDQHRTLDWLFRYDPAMVDPVLRDATQVRYMTVGDHFVERALHTWAPDLYSFPFLSRAFVDYLVWLGDAVGRWEPAPGDDYGAPELRLRSISPGLEDVLAALLERHVNPVLRRLYLGAYEVGWMQPPFLIRYDMHRQQDMDLHYDGQSELTIAVALNDSFEGGHLEFPRQGFRSDVVPIGHALVFPGSVSHLHRALAIRQGERRALTIWTRREQPTETV